MLGIIVATERELKAIREVMENETAEINAQGRRFYRGLCGENEVIVTRSGAGKVNAASRAQQIIDLYHPDAVLNAGAAGALAADLRIFEVVIAKDLIQHDVDTTFFGDPLGFVEGMPAREIPADQVVLEALEQACRRSGLLYRRGRVITGDQFIQSDEKKAFFVSEFEGTCVEMEGAAVAQTCVLNQMPYGIIRAISDGSGDGHVVQYEEFALEADRNTAKIIKNLPHLG